MKGAATLAFAVVVGALGFCMFLSTRAPIASGVNGNSVCGAATWILIASCMSQGGDGHGARGPR